MTDEMTPVCGECRAEIPASGPMCQCIESTLPGMELHRSENLARKFVYLEAMVDILSKEQARRLQTSKAPEVKPQKATPRPSKRTGQGDGG